MEAAVIVRLACFVLPLCLHSAAAGLPQSMHRWPLGVSHVMIQQLCCWIWHSQYMEHGNAPQGHTLKLQGHRRHLSALLARLLGSSPQLGSLHSPGLGLFMLQQLSGCQLSSSIPRLLSRRPGLALTAVRRICLTICSDSTGDAAGPIHTCWRPCLQSSCQTCLQTYTSSCFLVVCL